MAWDMLLGILQTSFRAVPSWVIFPMSHKRHCRESVRLDAKHGAGVPAPRHVRRKDEGVEEVGWTAWGDSLLFGTTGEARRLEAFRFALADQPLAGGIEYAAHVQGVGWQPSASDGAVAGTEGESRRVEALRIALTGEMAAEYSVWYRVHSQSYGWLGWAHDGEEAGTTGLAKRAEAVEVQVLPAGQVPAGYDSSVAACVVGL